MMGAGLFDNRNSATCLCKAMGTRAFLGTHIPSFGRGKHPLKIFGDTAWRSYAEVLLKNRGISILLS